VIAGNAPNVYVKAAKSKGFEAMAFFSDEQARLFKVPDKVPTGSYREAFDKVMADMAGHGDPASDAKAGAKTQPQTPEEKEAADAKHRELVDAAFRSQCLWDWTMADSVAKELGRGDRPVVQVVGRFHCDFRGGLVQALESYNPAWIVMVVSFIDEASDTLKDEDKGRGDYVIYVGPSKE
jgi:hypothetical protein